MGDIIDIKTAPSGNQSGKNTAYMKELQRRHARAIAFIKTLADVLESCVEDTPMLGPHSTANIMKACTHTLDAITSDES